MKKIIFFTLIMIFSLGASTAYGTSKDKSADLAPLKSENKLSAEEISRITRRVEEIRDMDKTNMTVMEKRSIRKELKGMKRNVRRDAGVVYIGTGTLLLIIILVILLV